MPDITQPAVAQRSVIEHALVEASHLLVSGSQVDLREVLRILGEAVEAESAYLVIAPGEEEFAAGNAPLEGDLVQWHRHGADAERGLFAKSHEPASPALRLLATTPDYVQRGQQFQPGDLDGDPAGLAIPVLSRQDRFIGYLGIEHTALPDAALREHGRVLSVFGDLLASFFSRKQAEQALHQSEERWREFVERHPDPILVTSGDSILYANEASATLFGAPDPLALRDYTLRDFLPADLYETVEQQRQVQAYGAAPTPFEHEIIRLDGEDRTVESVSVQTVFGGRDAIQTVLRDVTERKQSEERYRTFVQTISEGVWRIDLETAVSVMALPQIQADHILEHGYLAECNAMMTQLLGAPSAAEVIGQRLHVLLPLDQQVLETFVTSGYQLHNYELTLPRADGASLRHFTINAVGRIERGNLLRIWGSCVEVTERVEMERRMVAVLEEEQERIGRDLHDSVGQLLTGIRMLSENFAHRYAAELGDGAGVALKVKAFADEALQRVRDICRGLAPPQLYQEGLAAALHGLASNLDSISDVQCEFVHESDVDVEDYDTKLQLYRIAQEAANNALKHATATAVWIRLGATATALTLDVEDDGCGFDPDQERRQSIGLYSMSRRASSIRASLSIDSQEGVGSTVSVVLPLRALPS